MKIIWNTIELFERSEQQFADQATSKRVVNRHGNRRGEKKAEIIVHHQISDAVRREK